MVVFGGFGAVHNLFTYLGVVNMLSEKQIIDWVRDALDKGSHIRATDTYNSEKPGTLQHYLALKGWVFEDLRIALMKANPTYAKNQAAWGRGLQFPRLGGFKNLEESVTRLGNALKKHHEHCWHREEGYDESELCKENIAALTAAGIKAHGVEL